MNLNTIPIQATTRKLNANYTLEVQQDLVSLYSCGEYFAIDYNTKDEIKLQYKTFKCNWPFKMYPTLGIEEQMMEILNQQLTKEINREILNKMTTQFGSNLRI